MAELLTVSLAALIPSPRNRAVSKVRELAASIRAAGKMLQPPVVRLHPSRPECYEIIAGHRRCAAAELLGWTEITVLLIVAEETALLRAAENTGREDFKPWELCEEVTNLLESYDMRRVSEALCYSTSHIANLARVRAKLIPEAWEVFKAEGGKAKIADWIRLAGCSEAVQRREIMGENAKTRAPVKQRRATTAQIGSKLRKIPESDIRARTLRWVIGAGTFPES